MNQWTWKKLQADTLHYGRARSEYLLWLRDMGGVASWLRPRVFGMGYAQLGDHWIGLSHLIRFRRISRKPHRLSLQASVNFFQEQRISLIQEIAGILQVQSEVEFTDVPAELGLPAHPARNGNTLLHPRCFRSSRRFIAYQFDAISHSHLNPTSSEVMSFLGCFDQSELRRIGRPLTLGESMDLLVHSRLFIGVSSGMSHMAASACTPALIYIKGGLNSDGGISDYNRIRRWNPYPNTYFFSNISDLAVILRKVPALRAGRI